MSRTHAALVEALNRHRGKGQQKVTVEHVHVHAGGQAVVGIVEAGEGLRQKLRDNPMRNLPVLRSHRCGAKRRAGGPYGSPAMKNGRCRMHGGTNPGALKGNRNALKHGLYAAEVIARCRAFSSMLRDMRALIDAADEACATLKS
jgi:hypothetical protein